VALKANQTIDCLGDCGTGFHFDCDPFLLPGESWQHLSSCCPSLTLTFLLCQTNTKVSRFLFGVSGN